MTCLDTAAAAIAADFGETLDDTHRDGARAALDDIDRRLKLLNPADITAILDYITDRTAYGAWGRIPDHVFQVLAADRQETGQ